MEKKKNFCSIHEKKNNILFQKSENHQSFISNNLCTKKNFFKNKNIQFFKK